MASLPAPPIRVLMLLTVPVLRRLPRVSLLLPAPRSTDMAAVSAVPSVMASLPVPPVRVSTLPTVAVLATFARSSLSLPAPRSTLALVSGGGRG